MATKKNIARKRNGKLDIGSDPPVVVGGGSSTWIWIKRDTNPQIFDPANIPNTITPPDPAITPQNPGLYNLMYLGALTVTTVHFRNGDGGSSNHSIPNNPNGRKKNHTYFD